jgi:hypothetical protein
MQANSNIRGDPLPQSLNLLMKFSVGICTTIPLVINLPTKSPTEMLRQ